jgi:hypothetical protein
MSFRADGVAIDPNPAVEGQPVRIVVTGPGPWYISRDGSGTLTEVTPHNGEIELLTPPGTGGQSFTVTDLGEPPIDGSFSIVSPQP